LVHPRCVDERQEDLAEVRQMLAAGEDEIARDELRFLLEDCRDFIEAHRLLGELALAEGDIKLARAHFGFAYDIGLRALPENGLDAPLSYALPANQPFLEAAKGLAWCFKEQGRRSEAQGVVEKLLQLDPGDPLAVRGLIK
jgi:tetratricopeptide (TPR) repeat protein